MKKASIVVFSILLPLIVTGCAKEWQNPDTALPAKKLKITSILVSPHAYDSAGVIVEGKVWDLTFNILEEKDSETPYTSFKIADKDGNFINVFALGHVPLFEGDLVEVKGIYRREYITERHSFINEIEAVSIEKIK
ncbi:MAG: hypothetical protein KatS3mg078_1486 [Deltaproteobacteria bacterium]|jgi:hypothetical protein|nr:MAG: hypothetical protein KatS3mg078_1486 [Deltaproteobacteria bacterium]